MSKRIMIVGGTGFFGKSLFRYLARSVEGRGVT